jgi:hypothetical protein
MILSFGNQCKKNLKLFPAKEVWFISRLSVYWKAKSGTARGLCGTILFLMS